MTYAERRATGFAFGRNCKPPADLVGGFVCGSLDAARQVVQAEALFRAYHELELPAGMDPDREAFGTVYQYPHAEYVAHVRQHGTPKGYTGLAACCRVTWDIDRAGNLDAALTDTRTLTRFLTNRYPELADRGLSVAFSGGKGFHVIALSVPGFDPLPHTPAIVKRFALAVAKVAGVKIDGSIYHHQALIRLPNSRHPKTGLYKRFFDLEDLDRLSVASILEAAKYPSGFPVRLPEDGCEQLPVDWEEAERVALNGNCVLPNGRRVAPPGSPVVPKFVRDFIGFGDIQDPGRAVTLWKCAAALAEAGTPGPVVFGLLAEPAEKTGLDPDEVNRQIRSGIEHGAGGGKGVNA